MLDSVQPIPIKLINDLPTAYQIPDPLPQGLLAPLCAAEDAIARLDERLAKSPLRAGWSDRTDLADACASLGLDGELVHLEDLLLHDAGMNTRAPSHELTRAHAILNARRRIAAAKPEWALSRAGVNLLSGHARLDDGGFASARAASAEEPGHVGGQTFAAGNRDELFADAFASLDAAMASTQRALADDAPLRVQHVESTDDEARLAEWRRLVDRTVALPPTLAAAIAGDAWDSFSQSPWLGRLLAAALLRERGKTRTHLACANVGLRMIARERRRSFDQAIRIGAWLAAFAAGAEAGLRDHDRWATAQAQLVRKLAGRRSNSKLPDLVDLVMRRPIVTAGMISSELAVTPRAALDMIAELSLRETTGRGRYRAWGVL